MGPTVFALVLFVGVLIATVEAICTMNQNEVAPRPAGVQPTPRQIFIDRLRATGTPEQADFAHILELTEAPEGETAEDLSEGYRNFLAQLAPHLR